MNFCFRGGCGGCGIVGVESLRHYLHTVLFRILAPLESTVQNLSTMEGFEFCTFHIRRVLSSYRIPQNLESHPKSIVSLHYTDFSPWYITYAYLFIVPIKSCHTP